MKPIEFVRSAAEGSVLAIIGPPRTGKSRLAKAAADAGCWPRRLIFEPHGLRDRIEATRGRQLYPWRGVLVTVGQLLATPAMLDRDPLRLVVVPEARGEEARGRDFAAVGDLAWSTGGLTVIGEEFAIYARRAVEVANLIATGGGHAGMRLVVISQSWGRIPVDVRRCVSHLACFGASDAGDIKALRQTIGKRRTAAVAALQVGDPPILWRQGDAAT